MQIDTDLLDNSSVSMMLDDGSDVEARLDTFGITLIVTKDGKVIGNKHKYYKVMLPKNENQENLFNVNGD